MLWGELPMRARTVVMGLLLAGVAACGGEPKAANESANAAVGNNAAVVANSASAQSCPDDGSRLELTGLCSGRAVAYLNAVDGFSAEAPDGCAWQVAETELAGGDVLLYRGLKCGANETKLEFSADATRGALNLVSSAMQGKLSEPIPVISMFVAEGDPAAAVTLRAREMNPDRAEAAKCAARPARVDYWPRDAMVVDTDPKGSTTPDGSPVAVCGDGGYFDEGTRFWRVVQGYAFLFDFGQDMVEVDPGSLTLMAQGEDGQYHPL